MNVYKIEFNEDVIFTDNLDDAKKAYAFITYQHSDYDFTASPSVTKLKIRNDFPSVDKKWENGFENWSYFYQ